MKWKKQLINAGLLLFPLSFGLPIPLKYKSLALILFCITTLILGDFKSFNPRLFYRNKVFFLFIVYYLTGILISLVREGMFVFDEVKLSFLILPVIFSVSPDVIRSNFKKILDAFVLGILLYIIYCIGYLVYFYGWYYTGKDFTVDYYLKYVLYNYLPGAIHHTYLGMFINFSIAWVLFRKEVNPVYKTTLVMILFLVLPFLGSKWSLPAAIFILSVWLFRFRNTKEIRKWFFAGIVSFSGVLIVLVLTTDLFRTFFSSVSQRIQLIECSWQGIQNHWLLGMGKSSIKNWMQTCTSGELAMDTHNIFLQELLSSGIIACIVLFLLLYHLFRYARKIIFFQVFLALILLYGLIEHIFDLQLGVTFFCFFSVILLIRFQNEQKSKATMD